MESKGHANSCRSNCKSSRPQIGLHNCCSCSPRNTNLNIYVIILALLASLSSIMSGYCLGITSVAVIFIRKELDLDKMQEQVLVASLVLISMVGNIFAGRLADTIGRKKTIAIAAFISVIGSILMALSPTFGILMIGRLVTGISVGIFYVIVPLYIAEVSPPEIRGMLISLPEIFLNLGILLGYLSGFFLARLPPCINWRIMFILGIIPATVIAFAVWWMPESPRWLVLTKKFDQAATVLRKIAANEDKIEEMVATKSRRTVDSNGAASSECSCGGGDSSFMINEHNPLLHAEEICMSSSKSATYELLCPTPAMRKVIFVAVVFQFFNQASGVAAILYYAPTVFENAKLSDEAGALKANVLVGIFKTIFILIATMQVDKTGRRPLLFASGLGMSLSMAVLATSLLIVQKRDSADLQAGQLELQHKYYHNFSSTGLVAVTATCCYVAFFSIGFGPINNLLLSELFPLKLRAVGMGLSMVVNRTLSGIISLFFLTVSAGVSPAGTFFAFALVSAFSMVFVYFCVPETRGKELETIHASDENAEV